MSLSDSAARSRRRSPHGGCRLQAAGGSTLAWLTPPQASMWRFVVMGRRGRHVKRTGSLTAGEPSSAGSHRRQRPSRRDPMSGRGGRRARWCRRSGRHPARSGDHEDRRPADFQPRRTGWTRAVLTDSPGPPGGKRRPAGRGAAGLKTRGPAVGALRQAGGMRIRSITNTVAFAVGMLPQSTLARCCSSITRAPGSPVIVNCLPCTVVTCPAAASPLAS